MSPAKRLAVLFLVVSLEPDMFSSTGFYTTRAFSRWSPASSDRVAPNHGRIGLSCLARGHHMPGRLLLGPVREGHDLSSRPWLVEIGDFGGCLV
jgi:hypothetical protein